MMKWISIILGLLFGSKPAKGGGLNFKEMALEVIDEAMARGRKPIALILLGCASIVFICGGIFISIIDATRQWDIKGSIFFGATFWAGLILAAVFLAGYVYVFTHAWPGMKHLKAKAKAHEHEAHRQGPPGLDEALSLLIMDHIDSRKQSRAEKEARKARANAAAGSYAKTDRKNEPPTPPTGFA